MIQKTGSLMSTTAKATKMLIFMKLTENQQDKDRLKNSIESQKNKVKYGSIEFP
jgi:hypothetical protein